jgi:hypothetical protein
MKRFAGLCLLLAGVATTAYAATPSVSPAAPGATLVLEGLVSSGARTTGLALANLDASAAQCTVSLTSAEGALLGQAAAVALAPRSHRYLDDVFAGFGELAGARAAVSCDRPFYAFGVIADQATGEVAVVDPTPSAVKISQGPCSPGSRSVCFDAPGVVHEPTEALPVKRVAFAVPAGVYGRVKMSLDLTVGPWYAPEPDGKHLVYWFVLNRNFDMLGMLYFRGPNAYTALARYGIGLTHPQKIKLVKPFKAIPGHTYHCENDLDMTAGVINITVTDKGTGEVVRLRGVANVKQLTVKSGDRFIIDMGFPENVNPDEVPSYDSIYRDIHIEAIPK